MARFKGGFGVTPFGGFAKQTSTGMFRKPSASDGYESWQLQNFSKNEANLQRVFGLTSGLMTKTRPLYGGAGETTFKPRKGWEDIWKGLNTASSEQRATLDEIFSSWNTDVSRPGKFIKRNKDKLEGFMSGVHDFLRDKGGWDWDFDTNQWMRSEAGLAQDRNKKALEYARTLPGKRYTGGQSWADFNVTKKTY